MRTHTLLLAALLIVFGPMPGYLRRMPISTLTMNLMGGQFGHWQESLCGGDKPPSFCLQLDRQDPHPCLDSEPQALCDDRKRNGKCDTEQGLVGCKKTCQRCSECSNGDDDFCNVFGIEACDNNNDVISTMSVSMTWSQWFKWFKCPKTCGTCA